ncbi:hypothetical protein FB45DRAFT_1051276, partial [Roridomyces roridus]
MLHQVHRLLGMSKELQRSIQQQTMLKKWHSPQSTLLCAVEQTVVVNHTENQVRLQRLEGMMARVLREEKFGQDIMIRTMEIISSDTEHATL